MSCKGQFSFNLVSYTWRKPYVSPVTAIGAWNGFRSPKVQYFEVLLSVISRWAWAMCGAQREWTESLGLEGHALVDAQRRVTETPGGLWRVTPSAKVGRAQCEVTEVSMHLWNPTLSAGDCHAQRESSVSSFICWVEWCNFVMFSLVLWDVWTYCECDSGLGTSSLVSLCNVSALCFGMCVYVW